MTTVHGTGRNELQRIAHEAMLQRGLLPDFSPAVIAETNRITRAAASLRRGDSRFARSALGLDRQRRFRAIWISSRLPNPRQGGAVKILVAIADVDALVKKDSAIDGHARTNTTSVYTAAQIFPMLPKKLSTDLTSLGEGQERLAIVVDMVIAADGTVTASDIYRAVVLNRAKLAYNGVAAWLEGRAPAPPKLAAVPGLDEQLRIQDRAAQALRRVRQARGALRLETTRSPGRVRRWRAGRSAARRKEPREATDRRLHDRGQRRDRKISREERLPFAAPRAAHAQALGPHRRAGGRVGGTTAADTGRRRAGCVPGEAPAQ